MNQETKSYQLRLIFSPLSKEEKIREIVQDLKKKIKGSDGVILKEIPPVESENKKTTFFYPIKKHLEGYYQTLDFSVSPDLINQLESHLRQQSGILRFMLTLKKNRKTKPVRETLDFKMIDKVEPMKEEIKTETKPKVKKEKVKLEELDKKLKEILGQ